MGPGPERALAHTFNDSINSRVFVVSESGAMAEKPERPTLPGDILLDKSNGQLYEHVTGNLFFKLFLLAGGKRDVNLEGASRQPHVVLPDPSVHVKINSTIVNPGTKTINFVGSNVSVAKGLGVGGDDHPCWC
jgi:hypothetical protein